MGTAMRKLVMFTAAKRDRMESGKRFSVAEDGG